MNENCLEMQHSSRTLAALPFFIDKKLNPKKSGILKSLPIKSCLFSNSKIECSLIRPNYNSLSLSLKIETITLQKNKEI